MLESRRADEPDESRPARSNPTAHPPQMQLLNSLPACPAICGGAESLRVQVVGGVFVRVPVSSAPKHQAIVLYSCMHSIFGPLRLDKTVCNHRQMDEYMPVNPVAHWLAPRQASTRQMPLTPPTVIGRSGSVNVSLRSRRKVRAPCSRDVLWLLVNS